MNAPLSPRIYRCRGELDFRPLDVCELKKSPVRENISIRLNTRHSLNDPLPISAYVCKCAVISEPFFERIAPELLALSVTHKQLRIAFSSIDTPQCKVQSIICGAPQSYDTTYFGKKGVAVVFRQVGVHSFNIERDLSHGRKPEESIRPRTNSSRISHVTPTRPAVVSILGRRPEA